MASAIPVSPLQLLFDSVTDSPSHDGIQACINKVDITRKGAIHYELIEGDSRHWYSWNRSRSSALNIVDDLKIPLAGRLKDPSFAANTSVLSYRPNRRLTLLDRSGQKTRILKGFRRGQLKQMIKHYELAHTAFSGRGVYAPDIIEYDTCNECLVMMFQPGERLSLAAENMDLFHLVGEALRGFQGDDTANFESCFGMRDELDVIDKRAARLEMAGESLPAGLADLRHRLETVVPDQPPAVFGIAHRDLHDKQFIQQPHCLTLLDFDFMCKADVALDPANFLAHLVLRSLQGTSGASQRSIDMCGKKFLQGLERNQEPGFWKRLRFYQATSFCRLALVYSLRPRWLQLVPDLVNMGNRCLDDLQRIEGR